MNNIRCQKLIDCSHCPHAERDVFTYVFLPKGLIYPRTKQRRNAILFLLEGELWLDSKEYPHTVVHENQFVLQPIGSEIEYKILQNTKAILYEFDDLTNVCNERFNKLADLPDPPLYHLPMDMCQSMRIFMDGMQVYIESDMICKEFIEAKRKEFIFILLSYYPLKVLKIFYHPVMAYENSFRYFIMQNYLKVKTVEEFAQLGNYSVATFRRVFKSVFNESAYQWMLKKKSTNILHEIQHTKLSISEIAYKYGFEDLSHFSHFCKSYFGKSPRALRSNPSAFSSEMNEI
ncbi:helix-turn-helix transcriptional regulator [Parabacteroides pacaensis]|uniref:helix-turn-helix transcriptional regulator n=1 Tax=Parabacteroides pacaensis TaxID=2086575 RepID=UPI001F45D8CF|nr:helix-turn-helix transcriptional regulator [Parabacteroides pacaensis]